MNSFQNWGLKKIEQTVMDKKEVYFSLFKDFQEKKFDEEMKKHTSILLGGRADVFISPKDVKELQKVLKIINENDLPVFILGEGTNIIVSDNGIRGVVINLKKGFSDIQITSYKEKLILKSGAGLKMSDLIHFCIEKGFSGLEGGTGIPGSIGGALVMNAGTKSWEIGDIVKSITLMDYQGKIFNIAKKDIQFSYRSSNLPYEGIVLDVDISLKKGNKDTIRDIFLKNLKTRKKTQPISSPSAGSIFKNLQNIAAGKLIDGLGLKGYCIGDAEISRLHANYIINKGRASAKDVICLIEYIEEKVFQETGITLEREVCIVGK